MTVEITEEMRARARAEAQAVVARVMNQGRKRVRDRDETCVVTHDGWCATHSTGIGPTYCVEPKRAVIRAKSTPGPRKPYAPKPIYDHEAIVKAFMEGRTIKDICAEFGAHRGTVSRILTNAGVPTDKRRGPNHKLIKCQRGHDMAEHGRPMAGGGSYCSECKRMRERVDWKRKDARSKG